MKKTEAKSVSKSNNYQPRDWRMIELRSANTGTNRIGSLDGHHRRPLSCTSNNVNNGYSPSSAKDRRIEKKHSSSHHTILSLLDATFSATIVGPSVVGYWRGTWNLSGLYIYPNVQDHVLSSLISIIIGLCGIFTFNIGQNVLNQCLHPDKRRLTFYALSRFYTYVFGFCCVNAWRGTWIALDTLKLDEFATLIMTSLSLLVLMLMKVMRNITAPPFALNVDGISGYFLVPTLFKVDNTKHWWLYMLDCAFSVGVIGTLVVFVWRGVWVLLDHNLFPESKENSAISSLIIGYIIVIVTFSLQPLMRSVCSRLTGISRLISADLFLLMSFLGTVNVWRGIWGALDHWLIPKNPELSNWITHIGCFVLLVLLNCSNSVLVRGVYIDAEEEGGKCVAFSCQYLRLFFKVERERKEARRKNLLVASQDLTTRGDANLKDIESGPLLNTSTAPIIHSTHSNSQQI